MTYIEWRSVQTSSDVRLAIHDGLQIRRKEVDTSSRRMFNVVVTRQT